MFWLWLIGVILIGSTVGYVIGRKNLLSELDDALIGIFVIVLFWPVFLGLAIFASPIYVPYIIGAKKREKLEKEKLKEKLHK